MSFVAFRGRGARACQLELEYVGMAMGPQRRQQHESPEDWSTTNNSGRASN